MARVLAAIVAVTLTLGAARAQDRTMDRIFQDLDRANLMDAFYAQTGMEPVPSGALILDGMQVLRGGVAVPFAHVAGDGAGGAFVALADGSLAQIGSEGTAAVLGATVPDALATLLTLGSWADALRFVGHPTKDSARAEWTAWRKEWGVTDHPENPADTAAILRLLDLPPVKDPFGALFDAARQGAVLTFRNAQGVFINLGRPDG